MRRWLVRNVLFPVHERLKGHPTHEILREMRVVDQMTREELEAYSTSRLRDLIQYAYTNVPYIHSRMLERGVTPADIRTPKDLALLPVLTKVEMRANREELKSRTAGTLVPYSTTGSTGEPLLFDLSKRRIASRVACRQRVTEWWGLSVGDPEIVLWGSPVELKRQDKIRAIRDRFLRTEMLNAFEMSESVMSKYLDLLLRRGCRHMFGYPSTIYLLCLFAQKQGRDLRGLGVRVVFTTGEVLWPHQRQVITETLHCPVADGYGGRDSGFISHECPQGGMHILSDAVIVEIVDPSGRPLPAGESGEIVVTDLYSHEVPFIRYATGDQGTLSTGRCRCGRPLPLLEKLDGRAMDFFLTQDGRTIPGGSIFYAFYGIDGIERFRVIQKKVDHFHIQIVASDRYRSEDEARIRQGVIRRVRSEVEVTFEYLDDFPLDRTGKFRCIVSEVGGVPAMDH